MGWGRDQGGTYQWLVSMELETDGRRTRELNEKRDCSLGRNGAATPLPAEIPELWHPLEWFGRDP